MKSTPSQIIPLWISLIASVGAAYADTGINPIPLDAEHWTTQYDVQFVEFDGRHSMRLAGSFFEPGASRIKDLEFADGTIEFDMWIEFNNSMFTGLQFRISEAEDKWEYVYFRPPSNHQYNAFQYYPHYQKEMVWQLHGHHQRAVDLPVGDWFHFKIEVSGWTLACTMDDQAFPFFFTNRLSSGSDRGGIRFISSSEVYVSNVVVTQWDTPSNTPLELHRGDLDPSYLSKWTVYSPVALGDDALHIAPDQFDAASKTRVIEAEDQGMISFTRYLEQPASNSAVLAEVVLESDAVQDKWLSFGYSDRIDLYLNGTMVFSGDNTFLSQTSKMRSRVHLGNDRVQLHLKPGLNKLQAIVYERSGGWGMIAKLDDLEGLTVLTE